VRHQDKSWAPHICCVTCVRLLLGWAKGSRHMPFAVPMIRTEPTGHVSDCYFCLTAIKGITTKSKHTMKYPDLSSAKRPIPHSAELPVPTCPNRLDTQEPVASQDDNLETECECDSTYEPKPSTSKESHLLAQGDLNDLVRDLNLSKKQAELLGSRLNGWNLLSPGTKISYFRHRDEELRPYFSRADDLVYCNDIHAIMNRLNFDYD
jgi:hypothetical protein